MSMSDERSKVCAVVDISVAVAVTPELGRSDHVYRKHHCNLDNSPRERSPSDKLAAMHEANKPRRNTGRRL